MTDDAEVLARLATVVAERDAERPLSLRLCEAGRNLLDGHGAAITIDNTTLDHVTVAATDELSARLEDAQEIFGQGPGRDAYLTGTQVITNLDSFAQQRWPLFTEAALRLADRLRIFALPMRPGDRVVGVLTLIRRDQQDLSESLSTAQFVSDAVGAALMRDPMSSTEFGDGGPWSERARVHQAIGMVCAQLRVGQEDAMSLLKAHAFAHDLSLNTVARLVTSRQLDFLKGDLDGHG